MRHLGYISYIAALLALAGCLRLEDPDTTNQKAPEGEGERVQISFNVAVPCDNPGTKAMGNTPTIDPDGFYIAVFGGSGYFNEWVKATVAQATANYDSSDPTTVYTINATLSISDSRLRVHFIANCPTSIRTSPPISGSQDTEEYVMSHIRSQKSETYNDGYWQKVILPNGIKVEKSGNTYVATQATMEQFPNPIVLVRDFARVYLRNLTPDVGTQGENVHQLVTIKKFGLAYAPSEGVIAPILSNPFTTDASGSPITVADNDETTRVYFESFFMNYQNYSLSNITSAPFNYGGYSPSDQAYDYYTAQGHTDPGIPLESDMRTWDSEHPENNVLYVYERTLPSSAARATRIIILAERIDQNNVSDGDRFYALDIVNNDGVSIPLLRNQSYTVHLLNIESGSGEDSLNSAAMASSATVSGDPDFQDLINISDGVSSIGTSFTEKFYVQPEEDYVMFRYIPTNVTDDNYTANQEGNELISIKMGTVNHDTGVFTEQTPTEASSQGNLIFKTEDNKYKVWISKDQDDNVIQYVRSQNTWVAATQAQINNAAIEKWGMIRYQLSESYVDSHNYFTEERSQAIHITGEYNDKPMTRNVILKTSPRQSMYVFCLQKYVAESKEEQEVVRIIIPKGLSRSVFPLEFTLEPDGYSLTPDGDVLPVSYGTSTIDGKDEPAFYFVKTISQDDYTALGSIDYNGTSWKYFDCHFKTTVAQNACTVHVKNRFFMDDYANDEFFNYSQRQFTWQTTPTSVYRHGNTQFVFVMDSAHSSKPNVWWDPSNLLNQSSSPEQAQQKGLSTSNRVLPPIMTVTLNGFTPQYKADGVTPETSGLVHKDGNTYLYYVGTADPTGLETVTLKLRATGDVGSTGSVTLSTANITDNPLLYASLTSSNVSIQGASFSNLTFGTNPLPLGLNKTTNFSFRYVDGVIEPVTIYLVNLTINGTDSRIVDNGDGSYTFTPDNDSVTQNISLKSTSRFTAGTVTLSAEDYNEASATVSRPTTFTLTAGSSLVAGTRRPYSNTTYVYAYYAENYSNTYRVSSNGYQTRFTTNNLYSSRDNIIIDLTKYGNSVEDGIVYFRYNAYDASGTSGYHYASATLAAIFDAIDAGETYTLNFKIWATSSVTFTVASDNYQWSGVAWSDGSDNEILSMYFNNNTGIKNNNNYYIQIGTTSNSGYIRLTTEGSELDGCKLTGATITYRSTSHDDRAVTASNGTISSNRKTWTASNTDTGDASVTITMASGNTPNQISSIQINYGYLTD